MTEYVTAQTADYDGSPTGSNNVVAGAATYNIAADATDGTSSILNYVTFRLYFRKTGSAQAFKLAKTFTDSDPAFQFSATGLDFYFTAVIGLQPSSGTVTYNLHY